MQEAEEVVLCVWCRKPNSTRLVLCPTCEDTAKQLRLRAGLPIREPVAQQEET